MLRTRLSLVLPFAFCLVVFVGCAQKKGVELQGKVVLPRDLKLGDRGAVTINFVPENPEGKSAVGRYSATDSTFVANMPEGKGVLPGKYKITVQLMPYPGSAEAKSQAAALQKFNRAHDVRWSKLSYEVTQDLTQSITIDLNKEAVNKN